MNQSSNRSFSNIWYATPRRAASFTKFVVFDDRGWLEASPERLSFSGRKINFEMENVTSISLVRQQLAWAMYLFSNGILFLWFLTLPQRNTLPGWFLPLLLVASNLLGVVVGLSTRWILVEYQNDAGEIEHAYFADSGILGWRGIFGGTQRLYRELLAMHENKG